MKNFYFNFNNLFFFKDSEKYLMAKEISGLKLPQGLIFPQDPTFPQGQTFP